MNAAERRLVALDDPLPAVDPLDPRELSLAIAGGLGDPTPADRAALTRLLTETPPGLLDRDSLTMLDRIWVSEARQRAAPTVAERLPRAGTAGWASRIALWQGDITTIDVGAIVNAANDGLTGCYQPFHNCVDNAIHTAAGPRLREDCGRIIATRGGPEPTGTATATRGWFLPSRYVIHTVGPIVGEGGPQADAVRLLASCYQSSLDLASTLLGCTSVAFPAISTGVFGYPPNEAAPVAIEAVRDWLESHPDPLDLVILVAFSREDEATLAAALARAIDG